MESILHTIKKLLGLDPSYPAFDVDVIIGINSAFSTLHQLGVGPKEGFAITGSTETWDDYLDDYGVLENVKQYIYLKTRYVFDPPTGGVLTAMDAVIKELEWRINVAVDPGEEQDE